MNNQNISDIIANLKGRRSYEEKKAAKLGFNSLQDYFEDKIKKEEKEILLKKIAIQKEFLKNEKLKKKKSCSCC